MTRSCGTCSLCCKVIGIAALQKPPGRWCGNVAEGVGCTIHDQAPAECRRFFCSWIMTPTLDEDWRPDRCNLVLWTNKSNRVIVDVDADFPDAWRNEPHYGQLKLWSDRSDPGSLEILVRVQGRVIVVFPEIDIDLGLHDKSEAISSGYRMEHGRSVPFACYVPAPPDS